MGIREVSVIESDVDLLRRVVTTERIESIWA